MVAGNRTEYSLYKAAKSSFIKVGFLWRSVATQYVLYSNRLRGARPGCEGAAAEVGKSGHGAGNAFDFALGFKASQATCRELMGCDESGARCNSGASVEDVMDKLFPNKVGDSLPRTLPRCVELIVERGGCEPLEERRPQPQTEPRARLDRVRISRASLRRTSRGTGASRSGLQQSSDGRTERAKVAEVVLHDGRQEGAIDAGVVMDENVAQTGRASESEREIARKNSLRGQDREGFARRVGRREAAIGDDVIGGVDACLDGDLQPALDRSLEGGVARERLRRDRRLTRRELTKGVVEGEESAAEHVGVNHGGPFPCAPRRRWQPLA